MTKRQHDAPIRFLSGWACALTACFISHVQTIAADRTGISLEYSAAPWGHLTRIADAHCAQFGKEARAAASTTVPDDYGRVRGYVQRFECVEAAKPPTPPHQPSPPPPGS